MNKEKLLEVWKDVSEVPGYQISTIGRVKVKHRELTIDPHWRIIKKTGTRFLNYGGIKIKKERILKVSYRKNTGCYICLRIDKVSRQFIIARLMLSAFVRPPKEGEVARHLDDDNKNNILLNLEWGYPKDNAIDAIRNDRLRKGSNHPLSKLNEEQVKEILSLYQYGSQEFGSYGLAKRFNVHPTIVHDIVKRKIWKHLSLTN